MQQRFLNPSLFVVLSLPALYLVWGLAQVFAGGNNFGANPQEYLLRSTGDWTLRALCLVLLVTPLRQLTGWVQLARLRRMVGLFVFFYALLHLVAYALFDMGLDLHEIGLDVYKRPFITVGFAAFVLLLVMAATSFNRAIKAMGAQRWQLLHRSVYAVAFLALLHFYWMRAGKSDFAEVYVYAAVLGLLLAYRVWRKFKSKYAAANA